MRPATISLSLIVAALFGCAYPKTIRVYDEECQIVTRKMELDVTDPNKSGKCTNNDCVAELVGSMALLAASTVVSGSIVIAGNVVYWLEKKANCKAPRTIPQPVGAST